MTSQPPGEIPYWQPQVTSLAAILSRACRAATEFPVASAVKGRIMDISVLGGATTVYLDLEWVPEEERKGAAELLAAELRNVAGK